MKGQDYYVRLGRKKERERCVGILNSVISEEIRRKETTTGIAFLISAIGAKIKVRMKGDDKNE